MRILFIEPCHVGFGGYFRAINICTALSEKKIKVDMLVASEKKFSFGKKTKVNKYLTQYELPRFYLHFFVNGRILRGLVATFFGLFGRYDIVHACVPVQLESNIPASILKLLGKKVVMDWDDYWEVSTIYGEYKIMKKYVSFCERKAPGFFGNMVVVSDLLLKLAKKRGAKSAIKIINGVNTKQFVPHSMLESRKKLKLKSKGKYLISFGNTYINDRAFLLFQTFEKIRRLDPEVKLLFNLDPKKVLSREHVNKLNQETLKNVINVGYIQQSNLGYYLGASDAAILIIGDSDNERANFPIRIGSYLNGESVIILNDINSEAGNTLKEYNCAIIDRSFMSIAQKTVEMLNNRSLKKSLKKKVIIAKEKLKWENLINDLINYYRDILEGKRKNKSI